VPRVSVDVEETTTCGKDDRLDHRASLPLTDVDHAFEGAENSGR
jgi:hypothetical protein